MSNKRFDFSVLPDGFFKDDSSSQGFDIWSKRKKDNESKS